MTVRELRAMVCKIPFELDDAPVILEMDYAQELHEIETNTYWNGSFVVYMEGDWAEPSFDVGTAVRCVVLSPYD